MKYVVKNSRLKDYLFSLGFNYKQVVDRTGNQDFVYLFETENGFNDAMRFFYDFRNNAKTIDIPTSEQ